MGGVSTSRLPIKAAGMPFLMCLMLARSFSTCSLIHTAMLRLMSLSVVALLATTSYAYVTPDGTVVIPGATSYNGLNTVPQMGWDNWNA